MKGAIVRCNSYLHPADPSSLSVAVNTESPVDLSELRSGVSLEPSHWVEQGSVEKLRFRDRVLFLCKFALDHQLFQLSKLISECIAGLKLYR